MNSPQINPKQKEEFKSTGTAFGSKSINNSNQKVNNPHLSNSTQAVNPFASDAYFSFTPLTTNPVPIHENQVSSMFISPGFAALQTK